jgi:glycosyltransferase involved in cell wall biosynthesis
MRVLVCHVRYRERGGEDAVFETEMGILRDAGVDVETLDLRSADLDGVPVTQRVRIALGYPDHHWGRALVAEAVERSRPDVVHFHNVYPLLGPGAIREAAHRGCATVQTLHNYRLSCLAGTHLRDGAICELCRPGHFAQGVRHACYRGSHWQSALVRRATTRQWANFIGGDTPLLWLALTQYMRTHYTNLGAPSDRVVVKPNSVAAGEPQDRAGRGGVFCGGRLSPEKGIVQLMDIWPANGPTLTVAGAGPLEAEVRAAARGNVRFVGRLEPQAMRAALRDALVVAMPSVWPEPLPLVALEAFAEGTPVVAFEGWSLGSVVKELSPTCVVHFHDFAGLAQRAIELTAAAEWADLSERSLEMWNRTYSHPQNRKALLGAYEQAVALRQTGPQ